MNKLLGGLTVVAVIVTIVVLSLPAKQGLTGPQGEKGEQGEVGARGPRGFQGPMGPSGTNLGAVVSADSLLAELGLTRNNQSFAQATSTVCRTPFVNATTTLLSHTVEFNQATGTDLAVDTYIVGRDETSTTSGSQIGATMHLANNLTGIDDENHIVIASTSPAAGAAIILTPGQRVVTRLTAGNFDQSVDKGFSLRGTCRAMQLEL